jgi:hypothetical protein
MEDCHPSIRQFEPIWAEPKDERGMATIGASSSLPRVRAGAFQFDLPTLVIVHLKPAVC